MERDGKWEWGVLIGLSAFFLLSLYPAVDVARAERRDGIRRSEIRAFKGLMEERNNQLGYYPVELDAAPHEFVVTEREGEAAEGWYLRAYLENGVVSEVGFDEEYNVFYRTGVDELGPFYQICGGENRCGAEQVN